MVNKIDHLGIAVENLNEAVEKWQALGFKLEGTETVPEQRVRVAMFPTGEGRVELLESTDPEGPIGRFIEKRGPGIHHVAFEVASIDEAISKLRSNGVRLIDDTPRIGAGGAKIAFVHPSATGVLIELCEHSAPGSGEE